MYIPFELRQAARQSRSGAELRELRADLRKAQKDGTKGGSTQKNKKRQWISVVRGGLAGSPQVIALGVPECPDIKF
jgi:hypothetical protein